MAIKSYMTNIDGILKGKAIAVKYNKQLQKDTLIVRSKNLTVAIPDNEIDIEKEWNSLTGFLGREIHFLLTDEIDGLKLASRKEVQKLKRDTVISSLQNGEIMNAKVINLLKYGAYLEIEGVLTVLLKNADFSTGFIAVKEVLKKGDSIKVKLKKVQQKNKILVQNAVMYTPDTDKYFEKIEVDMPLVGIVKTLRPDLCFVNLYPGVDGLASIPFHLEIDEGMKVVFEVKKIDKLNKKIRGKVVSIKE